MSMSVSLDHIFSFLKIVYCLITVIAVIIGIFQDDGEINTTGQLLGSDCPKCQR